MRPRYAPTAEHVKTVVAMEEARVNMHHPDFIGHRENFGQFTQEVEEQCAVGPPPPAPRTGNKAIIMESWVSKKGGGAIVLWQKRYLTLKKDGILSYYKMEGDGEPLGDIVVGGCTCERADALIGKRFAFQLYHRTNDIGKTFFFTAESEQVRSQAKRALERTSERANERIEHEDGDAPAPVILLRARRWRCSCSEHGADHTPARPSPPFF